MPRFSISPMAMLTSLWYHRELVAASAKREVLGRYKGSFMGILWSFLNPLFMLSVYTFVFSEVFKARWNAEGHSKTEFALVLFAGLIIFNLFSECILRAPNLITSNPNYVKKVVYPLEILPWIIVLSALFHAAISLLVWFGAYLIFVGVPQVTSLYLPLVIVPLVLLIMGFSWFLASIGVFLRDVAQFIGIITTALMFMSPIFYPVSALPEAYRKWLLLNPLTPAIEQGRNVLYWGASPDAVVLLVYWMIAVLVAWFGFAWFQRTRKGFADVL
jgi:lipopolysaccharide transport system permease protein